MNPKTYNRLNYCPRCDDLSFEQLETHSHCASCFYSPDIDEERQVKPKAASPNTGKSFVKRLEECDFSFKNVALLAVVVSLAACSSVNKVSSDAQNEEEAAKREQRLEMRHFHVDRHNF